MKRYILEFIHNGLLACGFGPIMWTIVYFFLEKNGVVEILTVSKVIFEIVTVTLLASPPDITYIEPDTTLLSMVKAEDNN